MAEPYIYFLAAGAALVLNLALTPLILFLSHRYEWYDEKNHRKIHTEDIPRLGGLGISVAFLSAAGVTVALSNAHPLVEFIPIVAGLLMIHFVGLVDDFTNVRAVYKFLIQLAAAVMVAVGPFRFDTLVVPFTWQSIELGFLAYPFTMIWIAAVANAVNLIDGIDGLAGGVAAVAALSAGCIATLLLGNTTVAILAFSLFGAVVAFLIFNLPPAKIFMGDSGSLTLGFILAVLPLIGEPVAGSAGTLGGSALGGSAVGGTALGGSPLDTRTALGIVPMITLLLIPVLDTATAITRRVKARKPIYQADREHIHHKLMDLGLDNRQILFVLYGFTLLMGLAAASWFLMPPGIRLAFIVVVWAVSFGSVQALDARGYSARLRSRAAAGR